MMSSPEGARQAFQIPAGGTGSSFQEIDAREERYRQDRPGEFACSMDHGPIDSAPGLAFKRATEMYDRDESWMLQQSHESDADIHVMLHGRKALRTNDVMLNDVQQVPIANHSGNQHAASGSQMVAQDTEYAGH
jgi:hypothetical protein